MNDYSSEKIEKYMTLIGESEITSKIMYYKQNHLWYNIEELFILHVLFEWKIKENKVFAFYLCNYYLKNNLMISFFVGYELFLIQQDILRHNRKRAKLFPNSYYIINQQFWMIVQNTFDILKVSNMVYLIYLEQDLKKGYSNCQFTGIILSFLSIVLNFVFLFMS